MRDAVYAGLAEEAYRANMEIPKLGLAILTWGNASAADPDRGVFAIKPSGLPYEELTPDSMVIVDYEGRLVEGSLRPSSDTKTHAALYRAWPALGGVVHTHSTHAVAWAQACSAVPVFGTTHADHSTWPVPCTPYLSEKAVRGDYELETGNLIIETMKELGRDPVETTTILVSGHGPFAWGASAALAIDHAAALEEICRMAILTLSIRGDQPPLPGHIVDKHWRRKHGTDAYYGQK
ncbi:MAG TPA: L-ribulose-5-phosphate 4-epimerase AraD [Rectinemataceae bacterium]|nr:L-ribulose-5-phosphate 4-epimerase AraD [Rectinemataceae bacterium]